MSGQRLINSITADVKFQMKHGFYSVYIVLSLAYIIILNFIPQEPLKIVLPILIYSDPAGLGLFFIGGMVLLEKEQGVLSLLYITPLKVYEYIISKIITLGLISTLVGMCISLASVGLNANYLLLISGTFLSAVFYTLAGFLIATRAKTVNGYLLKMIPIMLLVILPCLSFISNDFIPEVINKLLLLIPSSGGLKLMMGAYTDISTIDTALCLLGALIINTLLVFKTAKVLTDKVILNS